MKFIKLGDQDINPQHIVSIKILEKSWTQCIVQVEIHSGSVLQFGFANSLDAQNFRAKLIKDCEDL